MNDQLTHDRRLADWLDATGPRTMRPEALDAALGQARATSQRGRIASWLAGPSPWPPIGVAAGVRRLSPGARLVLLAVLTLGLGTAVVIVGATLLRAPSPTPTGARALVLVHTGPRHCVLPDGATVLLPAVSRVDLSSGLVRPIVDCMASVLLSPDGLRALATQGEQLQLIDLASGAMSGLARATGPAPEPVAWSPNGTYLRWLVDSAADRFTLDFVGPLDDVRRSTVPLPSSADRFRGLMIWSADETRVLFHTQAGSGWVIADGDGTDQQPLPEVGDRLFAISPDGTRIAWGLDRDGQALPPDPTDLTPVAIDVAVGDGFSPPSPVTSFPDGTHAIAAAWSPDGSTLAIVSTSRPGPKSPLVTRTNDLWLFSRDGAERHFTLPAADDRARAASNVRWFADGVHLAIGWQTRWMAPETRLGGWAETTTNSFLVISAQSGALAPNDGWTPGIIEEVFPSPDGRFFVYRDTVLTMFDLEASTVISLPGRFPQGWGGQLVWVP